jgi:hypothetical protein
MPEIGQLSRKYESNGDPGAIGFDPGGLWSYGVAQIETKNGTFGFFMGFLQDHYPSIYNTLQAAGGFTAATKGTEEFKSVWKQQATDNREQFNHAQHDFIVDRFYGVAIKRLGQSKINLASPPRSFTLADVIYSLSVMAGVGNVKASGAGSCGLIFDALCALKAVTSVDSIDDSILIDAIYEQKLKRIDSGREYGSQPPKSKASVRNRVVNEHKDALVMLQTERKPS